LVTSNRSNELKLLLRGHMQGQSNAVARNWFPSNYATLHLVHGVDFLCFRLFHGTLAQSQRKLLGPVRARVASSCQLLLLGASVQCYGILSSSSRTGQRSYNLKSWDPTLIVISRQYVAHPSLPLSLLLEFSPYSYCSSRAPDFNRSRELNPKIV
jgi:hypothetical protein